jgi:hypothetical protein
MGIPATRIFGQGSVLTNLTAANIRQVVKRAAKERNAQNSCISDLSWSLSPLLELTKNLLIAEVAS